MEGKRKFSDLRRKRIDDDILDDIYLGIRRNKNRWNKEIKKDWKKKRGKKWIWKWRWNRKEERKDRKGYWKWSRNGDLRKNNEWKVRWKNSK